MTRKKVKLAFISNASSRKATFKKRKKGLLKKVNELSTLCGIKACAIIYSPYDSNPEVWPSKSGVERVVSEFRTLPEMDQNKKMVDQDSFLRQRITKASENLKKQRKENRELEMTEVMFQCLLGNMGMFHMNIMDLNDLGYLLDQYLKDVNRRIENFQNSGLEIGESSNVVAATSEGLETNAVFPATTSPTATITEVGSSSSSVIATELFKQPQFRLPTTSHLRIHEQPQNQNPNQNQQPRFMGIMNHSEQMNYAAQQMGLSFMDSHHNSNHHHRHQPQQQQIPGESSTTPAIVSSSSVTSITDPNLTNNTWFR